MQYATYTLLCLLDNSFTVKDCLQQPLIGLFLIGLICDVRQINPPQCRTVVKDNVTHIKTQNVSF